MVVIKVIDSAKAIFDVDNYEQFVMISKRNGAQACCHQNTPMIILKKTAARLRGNAEEVAAELASELQTRLAIAGVVVVETRLTHTRLCHGNCQCYASAPAANAILAARQKIVEGAVGMAQLAIDQLEKDGTVQDGRRKKVWP